MKLENVQAIVTGAASGIGRCIAITRNIWLWKTLKQAFSISDFINKKLHPQGDGFERRFYESVF